MIDDVQVGKDAADFPVVSWTEQRGVGAREKIECRIMKTATGELTFVARGHVRLGQFEEGRPWQMLQGFAIKGAEELYQSLSEQTLNRHFANRSPLLGALLRDGSKVLVASFRIGMPVHLNCADAPLGQLERLHAVLSEAFVHGSQLGLSSGWRCAVDDARVETYDPTRTGWPGEPRPKRAAELLRAGVGSLGLGVIAIGILALLVYVVLMLVGAIGP